MNETHIADGHTKPQQGWKLHGSPYLLLVILLYGALLFSASNTALLAVIGIIAIFGIVDLISMLCLAWLSNTPVREVSCLTGPEVITYRSGSFKLSLGSIPGHSVEFGEYPDDTPLELRTRWSDLPKVVQFILASSGPLTMFSIAVLCIGYESAAEQLARGFQQSLLGAWNPLSVGKSLVGASVELLLTGSAITLLGILAAKWVAFHLLPLPGSRGGQIVAVLLPNSVRNSKLAEHLNLFGFLTVFLITILWNLAIAAFVWDNF